MQCLDWVGQQTNWAFAVAGKLESRGYKQHCQRLYGNLRLNHMAWLRDLLLSGRLPVDELVYADLDSLPAKEVEILEAKAKATVGAYWTISEMHASAHAVRQLFQGQLRMHFHAIVYRGSILTLPRCQSSATAHKPSAMSSNAANIVRCKDVIGSGCRTACNAGVKSFMQTACWPRTGASRQEAAAGSNNP